MGCVQLVRHPDDDADVPQVLLDEVVLLVGQQLGPPDRIEPAVGRDLPDPPLHGDLRGQILVADKGRRSRAVEVVVRRDVGRGGRPGVRHHEGRAATERRAHPLQGAGTAGLQVGAGQAAAPWAGIPGGDLEIVAVGFPQACHIDAAAGGHQPYHGIVVAMATEPERQPGIGSRTPADTGPRRPAVREPSRQSTKRCRAHTEQDITSRSLGLHSHRSWVLPCSCA